MWRDVVRRDLSVNAFTSGAKATIQAFIFNPGFSVVTRYRLSRLFGKRWGSFGRLLSRMMWVSNVRSYGCYISANARIGAGLFLPHPVGIVIGDGSVIGRDVTLYQNVTLGRKDATDPSYPIILQGVTVYAGATLLGSITIGEGATVAAGAMVLVDVPAGAVAVGIPAKIRFPNAPH
jgi:serine O-acetyltransferase